MIPINSKGQVMIESVGLLFVFAPLVIGLMLTCYFVVARKWADYWVYRAAICQTVADKHVCQRQLYEKLEYVLPSHFFQWDRGWTSRQHSEVSIRIRLSERYQMPIRARVEIPRSTTAGSLRRWR